jgi:quinol monooxygenase YgiN
MSITSILEVQIKPESVDEALAILRRILADTRAFDGCESVRVVRDTQDPTHFLAIETWESLAHDTAYRQWRAGEGAITDLPGVLAGVPRLTVAETLEDI